MRTAYDEITTTAVKRQHEPQQIIGDDRLDGGDGSDVLNGGAGADIFIFAFDAGSRDQVEDLDFLEDAVIIRAFNGNEQVTLRDSEALYSLSADGVSVQQIDSDTLITMTNADGEFSEILLPNLNDPFAS